MAVETGLQNPQPVETVPALPAGGGAVWGGLGAREARERLLNVGDYLAYFDELNGMDPAERHISIVGVSESMVDAFMPVDGFVPGREGAEHEMLVTGQGTYNLGGGANVIRGASLFAKRVKMITRTGQLPPFNAEVDALLDGLPPNVEVAKVLDPESQNAVKMRFLNPDDIVIGAINFRPEELGEEGASRLMSHAAAAMEELLEEEGGCTLVVSDYGRGQFTSFASTALSSVLDDGPRPLRVFVDPRPTPESLDKFNVHYATLTPNRKEAEMLAGSLIPEGDLDAAHAAAEAILANYPDIYGAMLTLDGDGAMYVDRDGVDVHSPAVIDESQVMNPSGAGDIVVAVNALLPKDRFDMQTVLDTAVWLSGTSATEKNTSTLMPGLISNVRQALNQRLGRL